MADAIVKLGDFSFNSGGAGLRLDLVWPEPKPTQAGDRLRLHHGHLGDHNYERITLPIPFLLTGATPSAVQDLRDALSAELRKTENVFTWNPDPDKYDNIYFTTYASPPPASPYDAMAYEDATVDLVCNLLMDPSGYGSDLPLTSLPPLAETPYQFNVNVPSGNKPSAFRAYINMHNKSRTLGNGEASEAGQWSGTGNMGFVLLDSYHPRSGTASIHGELGGGNPSSGGIKRTPGSGIDCSGMTATLSFWMCIEGNDASALEVRVGKDASNYFKKAVTPAAHTMSMTYINYQFTAASMSTGAGSPNWADPVGYIELYFTKSTGGPVHLWIDDFYIYEVGTPINTIWLGKKADSTTGINYVINTPETASGWTAGTAEADTTCLGDERYDYALTTSAQLIHPGKIPVAGTGLFKIVAKIKVSAHTLSLRVARQDKNGPVAYGDDTYVISDTNWHEIELGSVGIPIGSFTSASNAANMYSLVGLEAKLDTGTATLEIDYIDYIPIDGEGIFIQPPSTVSNIIIDSNKPERVFGSTDGSDDNAYSLEAYCLGDLRTLDPGDNTLSILAYDTANPGTVAPLEISNIIVTPRYDLSKKL